MTRTTCCSANLAFWLILVLLPGSVSQTAHADKLPPLWGYGIKPCDAFLSAAASDAKSGGEMAVEYGRYEDWLTGFISGLNLATGKDVLRGANIETALKRIRAYCGGHRKEDFFTATMDLVRMLSGLR